MLLDFDWTASSVFKKLKTPPGIGVIARGFTATLKSYRYASQGFYRDTEWPIGVLARVFTATLEAYRTVVFGRLHSLP